MTTEGDARWPGRRHQGRPQWTEVGRWLTDICGAGSARPAGPADGVAGAPARWVARPGTARSAARVLRLAADHGLTVVPRGAGTKLDWGPTPPRVDIVLDTGRLAGLWYGHSGERLVEVGAGTPVRAVDAMLARVGLRLPVEVPSVGATLGGALAAGENGPLRPGHGTLCEHLAGVTLVDASGRLTRLGLPANVVGGPVDPVDPVALADPVAPAASAGRSARAGLGFRLLCGSHGALGVLVSATLRAQPVPACRMWLSRPIWTPLEMHDLVIRIESAALGPAAIEVDLPVGCPASRRGTGAAGSASLVVLLEGEPADVAERAGRLSGLLGGDVRADDSPPGWWRRYPFRPTETALRIEVPVADLHAAIYALRDAAGVPVPVRGSAGSGVVHAALPADTPPDRVASVLAVVRAVLLARGGRCVVVSAPPAVRDAVDMWGEVPDLPALRRAKECLDPGYRLAPGRLSGI